MADKPTFLTTKGQRNAMDGELDTWHTDEHYRRIFAGLFKYGNLPEGCPAGFVEGQAIWWAGACGCTKAKGFGTMLTPAKPSTFTPYGLPYQWIPEPVNGMHKVPGSDYFRERKDPILYTGAPMRDLIEPYIQIMERTMRVLNTNIFALSQPVMIAGVPGAELDGLLMKSTIMDGETYIPVTRAGAQAPVVLDLKANDNTQNLISTIDWCDSRILEVMLSSNGMEKSSGVTTMETVSGVQSIIQEAEVMLEQRKAWCDECNDKYRLDMTVSYGKGMESLMAPPQPAPTAPEEAEDEVDDVE